MQGKTTDNTTLAEKERRSYEAQNSLLAIVIDAGDEILDFGTARQS